MQSVLDDRAAKLMEAQQKAQDFFQQIEARGLIRPGISESRLNAEIFDLARELYGISTYWHKRIVRAGKNTLAPYDKNPPDLEIQPDDILFLDLGPVFEEWEADFGRTFVLGNDPLKRKLERDVGEAFAAGKEYFHAHPEITAAELYHYAIKLAEERGWEFGGRIAGHLIGHFPHEKISGDKITLYVHPQNPSKMRTIGSDGRERHWIFEIHFVDREREIGGFFEELLTLG